MVENLTIESIQILGWSVQVPIGNFEETLWVEILGKIHLDHNTVNCIEDIQVDHIYFEIDRFDNSIVELV